MNPARGSSADVRRDGARLVLSGTLDRAGATRVWPLLQSQLDGISEIALEQVDAVDSAGLALLVALAERSPQVALVGAPTGMDDLRTAYRLSPGLSFEAGR